MRSLLNMYWKLEDGISRPLEDLLCTLFLQYVCEGQEDRLGEAWRTCVCIHLWMGIEGMFPTIIKPPDTHLSIIS